MNLKEIKVIDEIIDTYLYDNEDNIEDEIYDDIKESWRLIKEKLSHPFECPVCYGECEIPDINGGVKECPHCDGLGQIEK